MTSYVKHYQVSVVVECDAMGCDARAESSVGRDTYVLSREMGGHLASLGWTAWTSRSLHHYCPNHGPRPGHSMRLVWGKSR